MTILYYTACILTLGALPLLCKWFPGLQLKLTHIPCRDMTQVTKVLVQAAGSKVQTVCNVKRIVCSLLVSHCLSVTGHSHDSLCSLLSLLLDPTG